MTTKKEKTGARPDQGRLERVKRMLKEGLSRATIARQLGISRQALWQYIVRHKLIRTKRKDFYFLNKGK